MSATRKMGRREFLRASTVAAATLALSACGAAPTATPAPKPTTAPAGAPTQAPAATKPPTVAKTDLWLGYQCPLTGNYADYGDKFRKATELAVEQCNAADVVKNRTVKVQYEDDQSDPKQSASVAKKLADDAKIVAAMGSFSTSASKAAGPIYIEAKKVQFTATSSDPSFVALADGKGDWLFTGSAPQTAESPFLASWMVKDLGFKKIGFIGINNDWGLIVHDEFTKQAVKDGATIVADEKYLDGTKDFISILTKMKAANPDALMLGSFYTDAAMIQKQRADMGWKVAVVSGGSACSPELIKQGGDAVEGQYLDAPFFVENSAPVVVKFIADYKAKWNEMPNNFSAVAYDIAQILVRTIGIVGTDSEKIRDGLINNVSKFQGVTGGADFVHRTLQKEFYKLRVFKQAFVSCPDAKCDMK